MSPKTDRLVFNSTFSLTGGITPLKTTTRMHSSLMRTARSSSRPGEVSFIIIYLESFIISGFLWQVP